MFNSNTSFSTSIVDSADPTTVFSAGDLLNVLPTPDQVAVSKWFPGYRTLDLASSVTDETMGLLLTLGQAPRTALIDLRRLLVDPDLAPSIIRTVFPRVDVPLKGREYRISVSHLVSEGEKVINSRHSNVASNVVKTYVTMVQRALEFLDLVFSDTTEKIALQASSFLLSESDLERLVIADAAKDLLAANRLRDELIGLGDAGRISPLVLADALSRYFRNLSYQIPEISQRASQVEVALSYARAYLCSANSLPMALQAFPALVALSRIANVVLGVTDQGATISASASVHEVKEAISATMLLLQSAPSIELIPLSKFAEFYGEVLIDDLRDQARGSVIYRANSQQSKFEIADVRNVSATDNDLALLPDDYVRLKPFCDTFNKDLNSVDAVHSAMNVIADAVAEGAYARSTDEHSLTLVSYLAGADELVVLAMARSELLAVVRSEPNQYQLIFGYRIAPRWFPSVMARTETLAYTNSYVKAIILSRGDDGRLATPMPARAQTVGLTPGVDSKYILSSDQLRRRVGRRFRVVIPYGRAGSGQLELEYYPLAQLLGTDPELYSTHHAPYVALIEPGVDDSTRDLLKAVVEVGDSPLNAANVARSWLVERLSGLMTTPAVVAMTERAVQAAIVAANLDMRQIGTFKKDVYVRALLACSSVIMMRFGKMDDTDIPKLIPLVSTGGLSTAAHISMASVEVPGRI